MDARRRRSPATTRRVTLAGRASTTSTRATQRERDRLEAIVKEMKRRGTFADNFAPKAKAAESRLRHFDEADRRRSECRSRRSTMRLGGARTGKRAGRARRARARRAHRSVRRRALVRRARRGGRAERHRQEPLPRACSPARDDRPHGDCAPRRGRRAGLLQPDPRSSGAGRPHACSRSSQSRDVVRGPAMGMLRRYELQGCADQTVRDAVGRAAGALPDPAARARRRHAAAARRADRQPRPRVGRSARRRPRRVRGHGHRGHPRPLVPARVRPLPRVRRRLHGHRPPRTPRRGPRTLTVRWRRRRVRSRPSAPRPSRALRAPRPRRPCRAPAPR